MYIWSQARALAGGLEDELVPVGRPVRLGVLAAEGELPDVGEVPLARIGRDRLAGADRSRDPLGLRRGDGAVGM